MNRKWTESIMK